MTAMDIMNMELVIILLLSFTTSQLSWLIASNTNASEYATWNTGLNTVSLPSTMFSASHNDVMPATSSRYIHLTLSIFFQLRNCQANSRNSQRK